ncbi:MAG: methyltransferase domain-containing protein [Ignavibacteria bacterium]
MSYDKSYGEVKNLFGSDPDKILIDYSDQIDKSKPVLDIGAGQGRHTFYLAEKGFKVDAIDPSSVAVEIINKLSIEKNYLITTKHCDFQNFNSNRIYSSVLVFGLIQILDWQSINVLIDKIDSWTSTGSIIFVTAWSKKDSSYKKYSSEWKKAGKNSFSNSDGEFRTYLEENEILKLFKHNTILHHWEGTGKKHKHGNGPIEQHARIELVFKRN